MNPPLAELRIFFTEKINELLEWQQELREEGVIDKSAFINFIYLDSQDQIIGVILSA